MKSGGELVDAEQRLGVWREVEQDAEQWPWLEGPFGLNQDLEPEALGPGHHELSHGAPGVDRAVPAPTALADGECLGCREARHAGGDGSGVGRRIEGGEIDLVEEPGDPGLDARCGARDLRHRTRLEARGQLGGEARHDHLGCEALRQLEVDVLVVARKPERQGGSEREAGKGMMSLREGDRQAGAAGSTQEDRRQLTCSDEARRANLAVLEPHPLHAGLCCGLRCERGGDRVEPLLGVALAAAGIQRCGPVGQVRGEESGGWIRVHTGPRRAGRGAGGDARADLVPRPRLPGGTLLLLARDGELCPARDALTAVVAPLGSLEMVVDVAHRFEVTRAAVRAALDRAVGREHPLHGARQVLEEEAP